MFILTPLIALLAASTTASPIASTETSLSKRSAELHKRWDEMNPHSKREVNPKTVNVLTAEQLTAQRNALFLAQTETRREGIIFPNPPDASNDTFQFINNTVVAPNGGTILLSTVNNFPYLQSTGLSQAVGFMNPCSLNTPHWHPRANEFLTVVQGELIGSLLLENDTGFGNVIGGLPTLPAQLPQIDARLSNFTGMLFPRGLVHWQFNPTCEPAVFVAGFDVNDPGRMEAAPGFFSGVPDEVLQASVAYSDALSVEQIQELRRVIPNSFTSVVKSCAERCGIPWGGEDDEQGPYGS